MHMEKKARMDKVEEDSRFWKLVSLTVLQSSLSLYLAFDVTLKGAHLLEKKL